MKNIRLTDRCSSDVLSSQAVTTNTKMAQLLQEDRLDVSIFSHQSQAIAQGSSCNEATRLHELYFCQMQNINSDPALNELTELAAEICQTPIALIWLADPQQQCLQSIVGISITEIFAEIPLCHATIQQSEILLVPDMLADRRFVDHPLALERFQIQFYASVPLVTAKGCYLGVLVVMDYQPHNLVQQQIKILQTLSRQVVAQIELRQRDFQLERLERQLVEKELHRQQESILLQLANQIRNSLDLNTILQTTVDEIYKLLHVERCYFLWCLSNGERFNFTMTHEAKAPEFTSFLGELPPQHEDILSEIVPNLRMLKIDDVTTTTELNPEAQKLLIRLGVKSQLLLPFKTHLGQLGAIACTYCTNNHPWRESEISLLQAIAAQLAIALEHAELFSRARTSALVAQTQTQYLTEALQKLQQTQAQLVQHEKMSSLGQLVAGIAHEINNPINFISGNVTYATNYVHSLLEVLELYHKYYPTPVAEIQEKIEEIDLEFLIYDLSKLLSSMQMGTERIRQIVLSLRNFSRLDEAQVKSVDLHEGINNTLLILQKRLKSTSNGLPIRIIKEYGKLPLVECYAGQLNQVFMNILINAIDALDEQLDTPTITIHTEFLDTFALDSNPAIQSLLTPQIIIRIRDNGLGMAEEAKEKAFNPFFTTKPVGKGTGLGLSISYQIVVEKHGGILKFVSEPKQGTEFLIQIPVTPRAPVY